MDNKITCFISYSNCDENITKFNKIKSLVTNGKYYIDYSERKDKRSFSNETIWDYLYDRISGSSCTILLLTKDLVEKNKHKIEYKINDFINSGWVYNEISASLRDWKNNRINGLVCVLEDGLLENYNLPEILEINKKYIIFVNYSAFIKNHYYFLTKAMENRKKQIQTEGCYFNIKYDIHIKRN